MGRLTFLNGKFLPENEARVSVLTPGFLYGWGLFESMRAYRGRIVCLREHLKRLRDSARKIRISFNYTDRRLKGIIRELVKNNGFSDAYVRMCLWKKEAGGDLFILVKKYRPFSLRKYNKGFSACISRYRQNESCVLTPHKTANYLMFQLAYSEARENGFDEALLLNNRGVLAECSRSNIFFARGRQIFTPGLACGCLNGITRDLIIGLAKKNKISVAEGNFSLPELLSADEAFLTNSLMGVMPLAYVGKNRIGDSRRGRITKALIKEYNRLLRDGTD